METRLAILRNKVKTMGVEIPEDVLTFLANRIRTNIRRLEGALIRVASYAHLTGKELTNDVVENLLQRSCRKGKHTITIEVIQKKVAEKFDLRMADMTSKRRPENIAFPRQIAMFLSANSPSIRSTLVRPLVVATTATRAARLSFGEGSYGD